MAANVLPSQRGAEPRAQPAGQVPPRPWRDFLRMKTFVRPYAWRLGLMILISLAGTALGLVQPYLSKYLVDNALLRRDLHALTLASVLMFAATIVGSLLTYASGYGYMRVSSSMLFDMRLEVYRHLHTLSPRFYARARLGDLVSRLNGDVAEVQRISADTFLSSLSNLLFIAGSLAMMVWLSWKLFFVGIVLIPFSIALFRYFQIRMNRLALELRERSADIGTLFVETLMGMRLVACFNASDHELNRFRTRNTSFVSSLLRFQSVSLLGRTVPGTLLSAATIGVFLYGGQQIIAGRMSIGTLVAFMAYHARLLSPVQNLLGLSAALSSARVSLGRVLELFDTPAEVTERPGALPVPPILDGIEFRNVTLRHDGRTVLNDVSFGIPAGCFTVLVGPSGGGKSTIADLMVRLLDPDSGSVMIDGVNLKDLRLRELRESVVLIEQSPHMMHGTLLENISYARLDAGRAQVENAACSAGLEGYLAGLPEGLDTVTGERGLTLSAGERQRVAIARAFLSNPEVLILDEPSAALDSAREEELLANLRREFSGKTLIAITHKPLLASMADYILRIEDGRVIESSSRQSPFAKNGVAVCS
jgi:ATP-binding cassette, subfamily B, bacterial